MANCGKCMRRGPVTSNGFLNFLREYRKRNCGLSVVETAKRGAKEWNCLSESSKARYRRMGCKSSRRKRPKRRTRRRSCSRRRRKRSCSRPRRRKRSCSRRRRPRRRRASSCRRRNKCTKTGPVTNNGYLNFLRWYRRKHCSMRPKDIIKSGARRWCRLPQHKKDRFKRMACKVTCSKRRRSTPLCRRALKRKRRRC